MITTEEYAILALRSYPKLEDLRGPMPDGFTPISEIPDDGVGFAAGAYQKTGSNEIVIALTGTNDLSLDWVYGNLPAGAGFASSQVIQAIKFYADIRAQYPDADITFTGHSLGGGLASVLSVFFDRPATVFDPAPFQLTATNLFAILPYFDYYTAYQLLHLDVPEASFATYMASVGLVFAAREPNVTSYYTTGEILESLRTFVPVIAGNEFPISPGVTLLADGFGKGASKLHSMGLLADMIVSPAFQQALNAVPLAVDMMLDPNLYGDDRKGDQAQAQFLVYLLQNQVGVPGSANPNGNGMLDHFADDLMRLGGSGGTVHTNLRDGLIAIAMSYYYFTDFGSSAPQEFFDTVSGGIHFDLSRISITDDDRGWTRLITGLNALLDGSDAQRVESLAASAADWFVQSGVDALAAAGGARGNVMIGGAFDDALTGGARRDALIGFAGDDSLAGLGGSDVLIGGAGLDQLDGGAGDDWLSGGTGDDVLIGGTGADTLQGGDGADDYRFFTGDGADIIEDSDGQGVIEFDGGTVQAGDRISDTKWRSVGGDLILERRQVDAPGGTGYNLFITDAAGTVAITVRNWDDGMLGISLPDTEVPTPEVAANPPVQTTNSIVGDVEPLLDSNNAIVYDQWGNVVPNGDAPNRADEIFDTPGGDLVIAGGGDDVVHGLHGGADMFDGGAGNDYLQGWDSSEADLIGGDGSDWLQAGNGDDIVEGDAGNDVMHGYAGADQMFAGQVQTIADAIEAGRNDTSIATYGELVDGGLGDDVLVGAATQDLLSGGSGRDLLIAGAGNDFISGDRDYEVLVPAGAGSWDWSITRTITRNGDHDDYSYTLNGGRSYDDGGEGDVDTIYAGTGDDDVLAGEGDDVVYGEDGDDVIFGEGGNDTLVGGAGDDLLDGGDPDNDPTGHDFLDGGEGDDRLSGADGDDVLFGGAGNDTLSGDDGNDHDGNDYLDGEDGDDILNGGGGADTLFGGAGDDQLFGEASNTADELQAADYLDGGDGNDTLIGGGGADQLYGGDGDDTLGGDASDTPEALQGDDFLDGGAGNDTLIGEGGNDRLLGGDGNDILAGESSTTPAEVQGNDFLDGGAGNDFLYGEGGSDTLLGGDGNDELYGESPTTPESVQGDDVLDGGAGDDLLVGYGGSDSLFGGDGDDQLFGDSSVTPINLQGDDLLDGGAGNDHLQGYGGDDTLLGGDGDDVVLGMEGNDSLAGGDGADILQGAEGDDSLSGDAGADSLFGGAGNDLLSGGDGDDILSGGDGDDFLSGGGGNDLYVLAPNFGSDHIADGLRENGGTGNVVSFQFGLFGSSLVLGLGSLDISFTDRPDVLHLEGFDPDNPFANPVIDQFQFTNTTLTYAQLLALGFDIGGTPEADLLVGTGADDRLSGLASNDVLLGKAGNDRLDGGSGADTMTGGAGDDTYVVDDSGDTVNELADEGTDTVASSLTYALTANVENLILTGSAPIDGTGNGLANSITGNDANNRLDGGAGADTLAGGLGDDTYIVDSSSDVVSEGVNAGTDTVDSSATYTLSQNVENLTLTGAANIDGTGSADNNVIVGNTGANTLAGGGGTDTLRGGLGDDMYVIDGIGAATVVENENEGTDTVRSSITYTLGANLENLVLTGAANISGTGNELANVFTGNAGANVLDGLAGADTLIGGTGDDTYIVDDAQDVIVESAVTDANDALETSVTYTVTAGARVEAVTLTGTDAIDVTGNGFQRTFDGNDADNVISGVGSSPAEYHGNDGNDTLIAGSGDDTLSGDAGADRMQGGAGNDLYFVDDAADVVVEALDSGTDEVVSEVTYTLSANVENLYLDDNNENIDGTGNALDNLIVGNFANNVLRGLDGSDSISGDEGDDLLDGGAGNDALLGGAGDDAIIGGAGDDALEDTEGANTLVGGAGDDVYRVGFDTTYTIAENAGEGTDLVESFASATLADNVENLHLLDEDPSGNGSNLTPPADGTGNALDNNITGSYADNVLMGLGGNDIIDGASGMDELTGDDGDDTLFGGSDIVLQYFDRLHERFVETILPNADFIDGGAGNDFIDGGSDNDELYGDEGNDFLFGGSDGIVFGGEGGGFNAAFAAGYGGGFFLTNDDFLDGGDGDDLLDGGSGDDVLFGGDGVDTLYGGADGPLNLNNDDELDGGAGIDYMAGGTGDDVYWVDGTFVEVPDPTAVDDCGNPIPNATRRIWTTDTIVENPFEGYDVVNSSASIVLPANFEEVHLIGTDVIDATSGADSQSLFGNDANNRLDGGADGDFMAGGLGDDTVVVDDVDDQVLEYAGEGNDTVETSLDGYVLDANFENLTLTGSAVTGTGNELGNVLRGNAGDNTLYGLAGNDELNGGAGNDALYGGDGDDVYRFGVGSGVDTVYDIVGLNSVRLLGNLDAPDLTVTRAADDIIVSINGTADRLVLVGWGAIPALSTGNLRLCECGCPVTFDHAPVAVADTASVTEDTAPSATGNVLANDTDQDTGTVLSVVDAGTRNGAFGSVTIGADGSYTYTLNNSSALVQSLGQGETETEVFTYVVSDDAAQPLTDGGTLTVAVHGTNDVPILVTPLSDQSGQEAHPFSFTVPADAFSDIDRNDALSYSAALADGLALPAWLAFDPTSRQFTGMPGSGTAGTYQLRVTATDRFGATANDVFDLAIAHFDSTNDTLQFTADSCWPDGSVSPGGACIGGEKRTYGVYDGGAGVDTLVGTDDGDAILLEDESSPRPPNTSGPRLISIELIDAGAGDDVVDLSSTLYTYGDVTVEGGAGSDVLIGGTGVNTLHGGDNCDTLTGGAANDVLDGGTGDDEMAGGLGSDAYYVDSAGDSICEAPDSGTDTVYASVSTCLADNVENLAFTGTAVFGEGNDLDNVITGNGVANILDGGCGADTLVGGAGDDVYYVDQAGDVVVESAGQGVDEIRSDISLVLPDNVENLTLTEADLCASATGNSAANVLTGNSGDNLLDGAAGADTLVGGAGNDTYVVDQSSDVIAELANEGIDAVLSSASYTLSANVENLTLTGAGDTQAVGNASTNVIVGNGGNNVLEGAGGDDLLQGGAGGDTYRFSAGFGHDTVQDTTAVDENGALLQDGGVDVIRFDSTITPANIGFRVSGDDPRDLWIDVQTTGDRITVRGFFGDGPEGDMIEEIRFADGTTLTSAAVLAGFSRVFGTDDPDVLNAVSGGSLLYGRGEDDVLNGGAGNDVLDGGSGCDQLTGGTGNDVYRVDDTGDQTIEAAGGGTDTVHASISWTLAVNVENLTLDGDASIDGTGNSLNNVLIGNTCSNTLDGAAGADTMRGGAGDDTYVIDSTGDLAIENANEGYDEVQSTISYVLPENIEALQLLGTANVDGTGNAANNSLDGNAGNNVLDGGIGDDSMAGGAGNDTYVVDSTGDSVTEQANKGTDTVRSSVTWALSANVENLVLLGTDDLDGTGNSLANVLTGNSGNNVLNGGGAADQMIGGAGDDTYVVNVAGDQVIENAGEGIDLVKSAVSYTLGSAVENLTLTGSTAIDGYGNGADNVLTGNSANNHLEGGAGNDTLNGGGGDDTMLGGTGDDVYFVNTVGDVVTENAGAGFDTVSSSVGGAMAPNIEALFLTGSAALSASDNALDNLLRGNSGANVLTAGAGIDVLEGGGGADILTDTAGNSLLNGGAGNDTLNGAAANDLLIGGTGNDTLSTGAGADLIVFNRGDGKDTVNASQGLDNTLSLGGGIAYADLVFKKSGNNLIFVTGANEQLTFVDWYAATGNHSVDTLQIVVEGSSDYDGASSDELRNHVIQTFDFDGIVAAFDAARAANPSLTSWALTDALAAYHVAGSDTAAIGGDLGYRYGRFGSLSDVSFTAATGILGAVEFGSGMQTLQPIANLQNNSPRLS